MSLDNNVEQMNNEQLVEYLKALNVFQTKLDEKKQKVKDLLVNNLGEVNNDYVNIKLCTNPRKWKKNIKIGDLVKALNLEWIHLVKVMSYADLKKKMPDIVNNAKVNNLLETKTIHYKVLPK